MTGAKSAHRTQQRRTDSSITSMTTSLLVRADAARRSFASDPALRRLANLAPTLFLELALGITVGLVGTAMAARVSDNAAAAFALANHVAAMLFILFRVVGAGVSVVITQNLGAARRDAADGAARAVLGASTWLGLFSATMAVLFAWPLMRLLNAPLDVLPVAAPFLQLLALPLLFDAWIASTAAVLRAHLFNRDTLLVVLVMHVLHLALAMPLMHGLGPIPALGLAGFAIAAGVSRLVALALFMWLWKVRLQLVPQWSDWWRLVRERLSPVLHIGLPGAAENVGYRLAFVVSVAAAGHLGAAALATQAYVLQISYLALMFGLAIGFSVEIVVGHMIGARKWRDAQQLVKRALLISLAVSFVATLISASAAAWLLGHFTRDPAIINLGVKLLWITIVLELGRTFNLVVINALRAAGDARYPVMAGSASMLVVLAGGSWLLGVALGWGLAGVWVAYAADEWIRGLIMWRRWATYGWLPHARSSRRRARRDQLT
jgi:putative MATE family efflux protein